MSSDVLVRVSSVSKKFCRDLKTSLKYGIYDIAAELNPLKRDRPHAHDLREGEFWAVKDVSFELKRGECLGLIGRNGAGKTTLLKMLNGLIKPDTGRIEMNGRVGALIALGAGFNPILTGRENIYVNGSVLGLTKREIDDKLEEIIDFAELRDAIDAPVQSYSSGMQVRLGFAIATALHPDILLLDEVLAVGDASFRHKCYHRINKLISNAAVILVSHSMDQIAVVAKQVGLMEKGRFTTYQNVSDGISEYDLINAEPSSFDGGKVFAIYPPITALHVEINPEVVEYNQTLTVDIYFSSTESIDNVLLSFTAVNGQEQSVMNWNSTRSMKPISLPCGQSLVRIQIQPVLLHDGVYRWNLWVSRPGSIEALAYAMRAGQFRISSPFHPIGNIPYLPNPGNAEVLSGSALEFHSQTNPEPKPHGNKTA